MVVYIFIYDKADFINTLQTFSLGTKAREISRFI